MKNNNNGNNNLKRTLAALGATLVVVSSGCTCEMNNTPSEPTNGTDMIDVNPEQKALVNARVEAKNVLVEFWNESNKEIGETPVYSLESINNIANIINECFDQLDLATTETEIDSIGTYCWAKIKSIPTFADEREIAREGLKEGEQTPIERLKIEFYVDKEGFTIYFGNALYKDVDSTIRSIIYSNIVTTATEKNVVRQFEYPCCYGENDSNVFGLVGILRCRFNDDPMTFVTTSGQEFEISPENIYILDKNINTSFLKDPEINKGYSKTYN